MRDNDTCNGPKCGFTENIYTNFSELNIFAALNKPSVYVVERMNLKQIKINAC